MASCKRPWPVLLMCCLAGFNALGMSYGLGSIFTDIMDTFEVPRATASLVQSVCTGFLFGSGIFSGHFLQWRGPRVTLMMGSVLATVGCVIAFLATHVVQVIVGFGVITGIGISFNYIVSQSLPGIMFYDIKGVAIGIASASAATGSAAYPVLLRQVANHYATRGTFLILAAMNCQLIVFGALIGLYTSRGNSTAAVGKRDESEKDTETGVKSVKQTETGVESVKQTETGKESVKQSETGEESVKRTETGVKLDDVTNEDVNSPPANTGDDVDKTTPHSCCSSCALHAIRKALSTLLELFGDLRYFILTVWAGTSLLYYPLPWMFMTDMVKSNSLSVEDGSLFITILFVGNLTGRSSSGFLYKLLKSRIQIMPAVAMVAGGVSCLLFVFCKTYAHFVVVSLLHGLGYGLLATTMVMTLMEIVGPARFTVGMGYLMSYVGIFFLLAGPYGGLIRDLTNSYEPSYYIAIGHGLLFGAVYLFIFLRHRRRSGTADVYIISQ